eukprot:CFRG1391T1
MVQFKHQVQFQLMRPPRCIVVPWIALTACVALLFLCTDVPFLGGLSLDKRNGLSATTYKYENVSANATISENQLPVPQILEHQIDAEVDEPYVYSIDIPELEVKEVVGGLVTPHVNPCMTAATQDKLIMDKYTLVMLIHGFTNWESFITDITAPDAPRLDQVLLLWNNEEDPTEELTQVKIRKGGPPVNILKMEQNSMNNRFVPWREIRTAAVYIVDMDIRLPGSAYEFAFDNWLNHQNSLVGYAYRNFASNGTYPARARSRIFGPDPGYNLVLTGSAMMPLALLRQYTCEVRTKGIRTMVDDMFNGDDIAMNLIAISNGHYPVALTRNQPESEDPDLDWSKQGCLYNLGVNGRTDERRTYSSKSISTRPGHGKKRMQMFKRICDHLGISYRVRKQYKFIEAPVNLDLCKMPVYSR